MPSLSHAAAQSELPPLCVSHGVWCVWQLEDKREALAEFKDLSAAEPLRLIEKGGMSVLLALLRANDTQLTRDVLAEVRYVRGKMLARERLKEMVRSPRALPTYRSTRSRGGSWLAALRRSPRRR